MRKTLLVANNDGRHKRYSSLSMMVLIPVWEIKVRKTLLAPSLLMRRYFWTCWFRPSTYGEHFHMNKEIILAFIHFGRRLRSCPYVNHIELDHWVQFNDKPFMCFDWIFFQPLDMSTLKGDISLISTPNGICKRLWVCLLMGYKKSSDFKTSWALPWMVS
jgi:hypothetical protein